MQKLGARWKRIHSVEDAWRKANRDEIDRPRADFCILRFAFCFHPAHTVGVRFSPASRRAIRGGFAFLCVVAAAVVFPLVSWAQDAPATDKAFIVTDDKSGHILLQSHGIDKLQIASLTKIASAVVVLDWARVNHHQLDTPVSIPGSIIATYHDDPIGFEEGDEISLRDLLYASMMQSDAIATDTLAEFVGRELPKVQGDDKVKNASTVRFIAQMNALARKLGMDHTRFLNPTGIDTVERPYSTAADLARLSHYALAKADFCFFVAQKERRITLQRAGANVDYMLRTTNEMLGTKGVDGGKTGSTTRAGQCLMVTSVRPPIVWIEGKTSYKTTRRLIVVVLGSPDRFHEASELIDEAEPIYDKWLAAGHPMQEETTLYPQ